MQNPVEKMMRSLDVRAAQEYMRQTCGSPFVPAPSGVNGRMYSGDENALNPLHKLRAHLGTPAEQDVSKAWLRAQGLLGLFDRPL